ncbi:class I SAM-dependent methyltransferase [Sulfuriflexus mobilis]|uniref:class I SAM-dependent methyltransferase n=1 Tax=Sulfuriflexus mobilis TaxID=1811807 RepID=UPI000F826E88|nr:class I SAM-dependent methyltransferase [Sulfuriflexus mobilis]
MELSNVIPWGRSFKEYREMFSLSDDDLEKKLLGCSDGPACFNAELTKIGGSIVSVDPVYQFNAEQIRSRIDEVYPQVMEQMSKNKGNYVWKTISSIEDLGQVRMKAMEKFLSDYEIGRESGRYINASLPVLPFESDAFDLALCSHYLFLYSEHINQEQHISAMKELCRVANEVRVYPLLSLDGKKSKHLQPVISALRKNGIDVSLRSVKYLFQKGATEMLVAKCV